MNMPLDLHSAASLTLLLFENTTRDMIALCVCFAGWATLLSYGLRQGTTL